MTQAAEHHTAGKAFAEQYKWADALKAFQEATNLEPNNAQYHIDLARTHVGMNQYEQAALSYERSIELAPDDTDNYNQLALVYIEQDRQREAIEILEEATKIDPNDVKTLYILGIIYSNSGRHQEALKVQELCAEIDPMTPSHFHNLAGSYMRLLRYKEAIDAYRKEVDLSPNNARAHYELAIAYLQTADLDSSDIEWEIVSQLDNELATDLETLIKQARVTKADSMIKDLLEKIKVPNSNLQMLNEMSEKFMQAAEDLPTRGRLGLKVGEDTIALTTPDAKQVIEEGQRIYNLYNEELRNSPDDPDTKQGLALHLLYQGSLYNKAVIFLIIQSDNEQAVSAQSACWHFKQSYDVYPSSAAAFNLATIFYHVSFYKSALHWYQKSAQLGNTNATAMIEHLKEKGYTFDPSYQTLKFPSSTTAGLISSEPGKAITASSKTGGGCTGVLVMVLFAACAVAFLR